MDSHDLVILYRHELFAAGIVGLLKARGVRAVALDVRSSDVYSRISEISPRVIVLEDVDTDRAFNAKLTELLRRSPCLGVIHIDVEHNRMGIYTARQMMATVPQDLIDTVETLAG